PLVLLAPAVIRPLADARLLAELRHRLTRRLARLHLPEDLDDLLRATSRLLHGCPSPDHPHSTWTRTRGSDHPYRRQGELLALDPQLVDAGIERARLHITSGPDCKHFERSVMEFLQYYPGQADRVNYSA